MSVSLRSHDRDYMRSRVQEKLVTFETTGRRVATVAICVATYHRPEGIRKLLEGLEKLVFETSSPPSVSVLVVDNDPNLGIGLQVCQSFSEFPWGLMLFAEDRRGISFARNKGLQGALALRADAIAFLDDDEVPDPQWLEELLKVQASSGAEIVTGPVLPRFEDSVPAWVIQGKFFERPRFPTGTSIQAARTGNLLILTRVLEKLDRVFDERFGLSGGEDTLLTAQLQRLGARIVWADEAIVRESVPQNRANAPYIFRRSFSVGSTWARVEGMLDPRPWVQFKRAAIGAARIAQGILLLPPSILIGRHAVVRSAAKTCLGIGMLSGLFGFDSQFYGSSRVKNRKIAIPKVLIIQAQIKQYRVPFLNKLHDALEEDGIALRVAYSDPSPSEEIKGDNQELPAEYGVKVGSFKILSGKVFYQHLLWEIATTDMVVVEQANKHVLNYLLFPLSALGIKKVAFWGHGRIRQRHSNKFAEWLRNCTLHCVDWWFGYTEGTARYLAQRGVPASKITTVQNTVDTAEFRRLCSEITQSKMLEVKRESNICESAKIGLFCGGIFREKMPEFLIESARRIRQCIPDFELLIVGAGPMQWVIEAAARQEAWIKYLGPRFGREKAQFFRLADVILIPGVVGLAILDAFSAGLPLVTSSVPLHGPEIEYLEEGRNGMMTAVDPRAYSDAVIHLLSDPRLLQELKNGALISGEKYTLECMVERFHSGIVHCLKRRVKTVALNQKRFDRSHHVRIDES